jgi:hypothetical protein
MSHFSLQLIAIWLLVNKIIIMSCLPDLFLHARSQNIVPNKIGGHFSLHLRSGCFRARAGAELERKVSFSNDVKRYKSWMDTERSFRQTKRSSRSSFYKHREVRDHAIDEPSPAANINGKEQLQSEIEVISNFNAVKKLAFEALVLARKTVDAMANEEQAIKKGFDKLKEKVTK